MVFGVRKMPGRAAFQSAKFLSVESCALHWCVHLHPETAQKLLAAPRVFILHPPYSYFEVDLSNDNKIIGPV